jgi:hypothetical protein
MAEKKFGITHYMVDAGGQCVSRHGNPYDAMITCLGGNGESLTFIIPPTGVAAPDNYTRANEGRARVNRDTYVWIIDALRNERCTAILDDEQPTNNRITFGCKSGWGHYEALS